MLCSPDRWNVTVCWGRTALQAERQLWACLPSQFKCFLSPKCHGCSCHGAKGLTHTGQGSSSAGFLFVSTAPSMVPGTG